MTLGPDEQIYLAQGAAVRAGGVFALRDIADEFIEEPTLSSFPSPMRWLWAALVALTSKLSPIATQVTAAALMGPLTWAITHSWVAAAWAAASPLVITLSRRSLQDVPVAFATLGAVGFGLTHSPIGAALSLFVCLCLKESSVLAVPAIAAAWLVSAGTALPLVESLGAAGAAWLLSLLAIFGFKRTREMFRTAAEGHKTAYAAQHQKGAPHRLLVDLVMASPVACVFAVLGAVHQPALAAAAAALIAAHSFAPIRNVRFILAADVMLRIVGASAMAFPLIELPAVLVVDTYVGWRIRSVYDPVTHALATALGMPASSK